MIDDYDEYLFCVRPSGKLNEDKGGGGGDEIRVAFSKDLQREPFELVMRCVTP